MSNTRVSVLVDRSMLPLDLPEGYFEAWSRSVDDHTVELTIDGPFPADIHDGDPVTAIVYQDGAQLIWHWQKLYCGAVVPTASGWTLPNFAGAPAVLNAREVVLPASLSERIQSAIAGGSFGGGIVNA